MIDKELLEILCCPDCHGDLVLNEEQARLTCQKCGKRYPIREGIPVMLIDEADPPEPGFTPSASSSTSPGS